MNLHNSYKLVTKEDPTHLHKLLGGICLAHYIYRYYLLFTTGTMSLRTPVAYYMVGVHGLLSCSSMIFHIPNQRIKGGPMIYPEYRLHSIAFALRSVVCYYFTYHQFSQWWNAAVCLATMLIADIVSANYPSGTTTMRKMPFASNVDSSDRDKIILFQSLHQITATLYMIGNEETCFSPMFAIQFSAFLMTLVRKSIISSNGWHILYNFSLWINIFCYFSLSPNYIVQHIVFTQLFYFWRFNKPASEKKRIMVNGNKYIGWSVIFVLFLYSSKTYYTLLLEDAIHSLVSSQSMFRASGIIVYCVYTVYTNHVLFRPMLFLKK
jgi:hypothetical protein